MSADIPIRPRWGIVSAGNISYDLCQSLVENGSEIVAVAARDLSRAKEFATEIGAQRAYSSYSELFSDPDVDIVYVGSIHTAHFQNTKDALEAGKHVLCEKPMGVNAAQVKELVRIAGEKKRFLLEGMWTRFFPAVRKAKEVIDSGSIGAIRTVQADFGFCGPSDENHRLWDPSRAGGGMLEIGCYVLGAATFGFGPTMPDRIACAGRLTEKGVDVDGSLALAWQGKGTASVSYTLCALTPEKTVISGERGQIELDSPAHCPTKVTVRKFAQGQRGLDDGAVEKLEFPLPQFTKTPVPPLNFPNSEGFLYQVKAVEIAVRNGDLECAEFPLTESIVLAEMMDEFRKQVGVKYPGEQ